MAKELDKQRIRMLCAKANIYMSELAIRMGVTPATLTNRLKKPCFTFEEQHRIARALDCRFYPVFLHLDGTEITAHTLRDMVMLAMEHGNYTLRKIAEYTGTTKQNISRRLIRGKLSCKEIELVATAINCKYENWYIFSDGTRL